MKTKNQSSLPSKYWLIIVIVICVILMGVERITGGNGPISFIANYTVIPMQKGIGYVGRYMSDLSDNFETLQDMKKENKKLQSKVDDLTIDNTRLRQDQYELERLRELYKLDENYSDYKKIGAHVISNSGSNWFSDFTIDKGSKDGIKKNCNVLAGSGLVGIVTEVGPHYARVRSIIDDESNISAMLLSTSDTCVVRGDLKQMENGRIRFEKLANNDNKIEVGEQVVAIGNALGYGQSVTSGWISALNRSISTSDGTTSDGLIQTDTAINPGNSGGALLNMQGEVIGINSAKYADSAVEGMGYAIPISKAQPILEDLMNRQTRDKVEDDSKAAYLGITSADLSMEAIQMYDMPEGAFVIRVDKDSAADEAGIQKGDIIVSFDGQTVSGREDLENKLAYYEAGESVDVVVSRADNGEYVQKTIYVTLGNRSDYTG